MDDHIHPDTVETVRYALWGGTDEATRRVAEHARCCPRCDAELVLLTRIRNLLRSGHGAPKPPAAVLAPAAADVADLDFAWFTATPVEAFAGVRAAADSTPAHSFCDAGPIALDIVVNPTPAGVSVCGQVTLRGAEPAADAEVTLHADGKPLASGRTDAYGEFQFDAPRGARLGVRIATGGPANAASAQTVRHIEFPGEPVR